MSQPNITIDIKLKSIGVPLRSSLRESKNAFFIEGGGTRGVYAIGLLKYLCQDNQYINFNDVQIFGGTSVGSYLAAALSLGFDSNDIDAFTEKLDMNNLVDSKFLFMTTLYRLLAKGYLYNDTGRKELAENFINIKLDAIRKDLEHNSESGGIPMGPNDITFAHLKKLITTHPNIYKHLIINAVDISTDDQIFITTLNDKWNDIKLIDAILASSAIPFVFTPTILYRYNDTNTYGYIKKPNSTVNHLVDGGVSTNNPLDFFLINNSTYDEYDLWLLKFTSDPGYKKIDGNISMFKQLLQYLISGKNDIKMDLITDQYDISTINLKSTAGTLDIYSNDEIKKIAAEIYKKCEMGEIAFSQKM